MVKKKARTTVRLNNELGVILQIYSVISNQNFDSIGQSKLEEGLLNDPDFFGMVVCGEFPGLQTQVEKYFVSRGYKRSELPWRTSY